MVAVPWLDGGTAVATASRADGTLRVWLRASGAVSLIPLGVRPRCLLVAGQVLLIGHDDGLVALTLTPDPGR